MRKLTTVSTFAVLLAFASMATAQQQPPYPKYEPKKSPVQIENLTHTEIYDAIHNHGYTTVLVYNGGTEQRGPQDVLGGHSFIAYGKAERLAQRLGNALVAPVLPFSTNEASEKMPGTIGLTADIFKAVNERVVDQMVKNGFKDIVLLGDHGGGQKQLEELAGEADKKYSAQGVHVYFCGDVYEKSHKDFDKYLSDHKLPLSSHAGIPDTSELLLLQPKPGAWVRPIYKQVYGDAIDAKEKKINNGITGDPRPSSVELAKIDMEITVKNGYDQITKMIAEKRKGSSNQ
jgi:creatinine amidohydrolase/Fe(II)-dependent formamide hydrolase-like protein